MLRLLSLISINRGMKILLEDIPYVAILTRKLRFELFSFFG